MLEDYMIEMIVGIVVVTGIALFAVMRIQKEPEQSSDSPELEIDQSAETLVDEFDDALEPQNAPQEEEKENIQTPPSQTQEIEVEAPLEQTNTKVIAKRAVPKHDKITKQNFSEFSGERILVAEDNLINQKVLTGLLAGSGIDVIIANDGQEALDILKDDTNFLLILMDAHMPRVDGFEATRIIREDARLDNILVVALSGDTASDDIAKMRDAGMAEQLEKPLRMADLYDIFYTYTGKEKPQSSLHTVEIIMTQELNGDKGLEVCGGDDTFYKEILNEFIQTYENSTQKLEEHLNNNQMKEAGKLLFDIIGITANIGADPLHNIANEIKTALSDTQEKSYLTLADQYKIHLETLIVDIKDYLHSA